jgi:hypothetical protein
MGIHIEETQTRCDVFAFETPVYTPSYYVILPHVFWNAIEKTFNIQIEKKEVFRPNSAFVRGPPCIS